jgi:hypothetical protein
MIDMFIPSKIYDSLQACYLFSLILFSVCPYSTFQGGHSQLTLCSAKHRVRTMWKPL